MNLLTLFSCIFFVVIVIVLVVVLLKDDTKLSKITLNSDGKFINSQGSEVILRGANIANKIYPYTYGTDFLTPIKSHTSYIKDTLGFNSVRLTVAWAQVEPTPGVYDNAYLDSIFDTIDLLQNFGIYTLFDFHTDAYAQDAGGWGWPNWTILNPNDPVSDIGFPALLFGGASISAGVSISMTLSKTWDLFWDNTSYEGRGIQDRFFDMVIYVLNRIKRNSKIKNAIQGIGVMNEPWPGTSWLNMDIFATPQDPPPFPDLSGDYYEWSANGTSIVDANILTPYYKRFVERYKSEGLTGDDFILYIQPFMLFGGGCPSYLNFNTILSGVSDLNVTFNFHNYASGASVPFNNADNVLSLYTPSNGNRLGLYMSEFGARQSPTEWGTSIIPLSDEKKYSYNYWAYLQKLDFKFSAGLPSYEIMSIFTNPDEQFSTEYINLSIVDALSNPFPKEVPGTITSFGINSTSNNFELIFTLKNKSNKLVISVPSHYYSVRYSTEIYSNDQLKQTLRKLDQVSVSFVFSDSKFSINDTIKIIIAKTA